MSRAAKTKTASLKPLMDPDVLRQMAGAQSFARGEDYFRQGRVGSLAEHEGMVAAKVQGNRAYLVKLWPEEGEVMYSCTCPVGQEGAFCKHAVSVGLAWLETPQWTSKKACRPAATMKDVRLWLADQKKDALVDLIMEVAMKDEDLRRRLLLQVAQKSSAGVDMSTYRRIIDESVGIHGYVDYYGGYDYFSRVEEVVKSLETLLEQGHAVEIIELAEHALSGVEDNMERVDDSNGEMGAILDHLQEIHLKACQKAKPDPASLAQRLFAWELNSRWETFYGAVHTYARVLGQKGLAVYRQLAEAEWAKTPPLKPGGEARSSRHNRFAITRIMEALARQTGDIEALVSIKQHDLSSAYNFLEIAKIYDEAQQHDQALDWAERGVHIFPEKTDSRLRVFLANEYHRRGRHDEAMKLIWQEFFESPRLAWYKELKAHAEKAGQWKIWRPKALEAIRQVIAEGKKKAASGRWGWYGHRDNSELVQVFLWEKNPQTAWQSAVEGGCNAPLWMELAKAREGEHPADALQVYQSQIDPILNQKTNDAYQEAVGLLKKIRALMARLNQKTAFPAYLESVCVAHKPKRNFMRLVAKEFGGRG